ncbi:hypothetical protein [Mesorhizobium sp. IMUNJ 23232]|uniref:hypothetical protein n=1 Tax=Mesorhizobium sp. IMUNJ 23232 TaxID=3376064 RepID=UPI0037A8D6F7
MTPEQQEEFERDLSADVADLVSRYVLRVVEPLRLRLERLEDQMRALRDIHERQGNDA